MKKLVYILLVPALILMQLSGTFANANEIDKQERVNVKNVIENIYVKGWLIDPNPEEIKNGFHQDVNVYVIKDGEVIVFDQKMVEEFVSSLKKSTQEITWKFNSIDIVRDMAIVKLTVYKDGKLALIDVFNLYRTKQGWRVVAKTFEDFSK